MSKQLSVFMLNLQRILYRVLLIIIVMCLVEGILLYKTTVANFAYIDKLYAYEQIDDSTRQYWRSESVGFDIFTDSGAQYVFAAAFLLLCGVFVLNSLDLGGKSSYSIRRLGINEKLYFICESLAYLVCIVIFYASQLAVALGFCAMFNYLGGELYHGSQTALITFYSNDFLHSLLPMRDYSRMIRNVFMMLAVAIECGGFSYRLRHGKKTFTFFILAAYTVLVFQQEMGHWGMDMFTVLVMLFCLTMTVFKVWRWRDE